MGQKGYPAPCEGGPGDLCGDRDDGLLGEQRLACSADIQLTMNGQTLILHNIQGSVLCESHMNGQASACFYVIITLFNTYMSPAHHEVVGLHAVVIANRVFGLDLLASTCLEH